MADHSSPSNVNAAAEKLAALKAQNEARNAAAELKEQTGPKLDTILPTPAPIPTPAVEAKPAEAPAARTAPRSHISSRPRALRAISSNGNVLRADAWPHDRDPTPAELDAYRDSVRGADYADITKAT